jgi:hypothetical protein
MPLRFLLLYIASAVQVAIPRPILSMGLIFPWEVQALAVLDPGFDVQSWIISRRPVFCRTAAGFLILTTIFQVEIPADRFAIPASHLLTAP